MVSDGVFRYAKQLGDVAVAFALADTGRYFLLATGQQVVVVGDGSGSLFMLSNDPRKSFVQ